MKNKVLNFCGQASRTSCYYMSCNEKNKFSCQLVMRVCYRVMLYEKSRACGRSHAHIIYIYIYVHAYIISRWSLGWSIWAFQSCVRMYVCMYVCMYVYIYIYIYIHTTLNICNIRMTFVYGNSTSFVGIYVHMLMCMRFWWEACMSA